jgi:hypothetical protein
MFFQQWISRLFPSIPGKEETGGKRGCVILVGDDSICKHVDKLDFIYRYKL